MINDLALTRSLESLVCQKSWSAVLQFEQHHCLISTLAEDQDCKLCELALILLDPLKTGKDWNTKRDGTDGIYSSTLNVLQISIRQ